MKTLYLDARIGSRSFSQRKMIDFPIEDVRLIANLDGQRNDRHYTPFNLQRTFTDFEKEEAFINSNEGMSICADGYGPRIRIDIRKAAHLSREALKVADLHPCESLTRAFLFTTEKARNRWSGDLAALENKAKPNNVLRAWIDDKGTIVSSEQPEACAPQEFRYALDAKSKPLEVSLGAEFSSGLLSFKSAPLAQKLRLTTFKAHPQAGKQFARRFVPYGPSNGPSV